MTLFPTQPNMPPKPAAARPAAVPTPSAAAPLGADDAKRARALADSIRARFAQTLVGQDNLRESLIVTLVAGGHILIESVPGLAKTTAAQTLATCVSGSFKRVPPAAIASDVEPGSGLASADAQAFTVDYVIAFRSLAYAFACFTGGVTLKAALAQRAFSTRGPNNTGVALTYMFTALLKLFFGWRAAYRTPKPLAPSAPRA